MEVTSFAPCGRVKFQQRVKLMTDDHTDGRSALVEEAARRAGAYLNAVKERRVAPSVEAVAALSQFAEPMPAAPTDPVEVLNQLDEVGSPATVATAGSRYFGFVIGGSLPAALAANVLTG